MSSGLPPQQSNQGNSVPPIQSQTPVPPAGQTPYQAPAQGELPRYQERIPPNAQQYAPCPKCSCVYAKPIAWTVWGGVVGPWLHKHVQCLQCYTAYNGRTGKYNTTAIAIYIGIGVVFGIAVFVFSFLAGLNGAP